jgi:hypothetical protein
MRLLPREESRSSLHRPKRIGFVVDVVLKNVPVRNRGGGILLENWASIVGDKFHSRCFPTAILSGDVLVIGCCNTVVRSELELMKSTIMANLASLPHCKRIRDVRFRTN